MVFLSGVRFPDAIAYGSRGGKSWRNTRVDLTAGAGEGVQRWTIPRGEYDVRWGLRGQDDFQDVIDLWYITKGSLNGFGFRDKLDFSTKPEKPDIHTGTFAFDDQNIGTGDGTATQFQITKVHTVGSFTFTRNITKPITGVKVGKAGVEQVSGFTVNLDTGIVTFTTAPTVGQAITAGCNYDIPVQFAPELDTGFKPILSSFKAATLNPIRLIEMTSNVIVPQRYFHGGGSEQTLTATTASEFSMGAAVAWSAATTQRVLLPDPTTLDTGIAYHQFKNVGAASVEFFKFDNTGTDIFTMTAASDAQTFIYLSSGVKTWGAHQ